MPGNIKFDILANIYFARYYSNLPVTAETTWLFSTYDYTLYSQQDIMHNFGYHSLQQILESENYIPFVRVDIHALKLEYINQYFPKEALILDEGNLDVSFAKMIEKLNSVSHWYFYERYALQKAVTQWCKENRIAYISN